MLQRKDEGDVEYVERHRRHGQKVDRDRSREMVANRRSSRSARAGGAVAG